MTLFENLTFIEFYQTEKCNALIGWPMTNLGWEYYTEKNGAKTPTIPTSENISYFVAGGNNCCHPMNGKILQKCRIGRHLRQSRFLLKKGLQSSGKFKKIFTDRIADLRRKFFEKPKKKLSRTKIFQDVDQLGCLYGVTPRVI